MDKKIWLFKINLIFAAQNYSLLILNPCSLYEKQLRIVLTSFTLVLQKKNVYQDYLSYTIN